MATETFWDPLEETITQETNSFVEKPVENKGSFGHNFTFPKKNKVSAYMIIVGAAFVLLQYLLFNPRIIEYFKDTRFATYFLITIIPVTLLIARGAVSSANRTIKQEADPLIRLAKLKHWVTKTSDDPPRLRKLLSMYGSYIYTSDKASLAEQGLIKYQEIMTKASEFMTPGISENDEINNRSLRMQVWGMNEGIDFWKGLYSYEVPIGPQRVFGQGIIIAKLHRKLSLPAPLFLNYEIIKKLKGIDDDFASFTKLFQLEATDATMTKDASIQKLLTNSFMQRLATLVQIYPIYTITLFDSKIMIVFESKDWKPNDSDKPTEALFTDLLKTIDTISKNDC